MKRHLGLVLVAVALFIRYRPAPNPEPPAPGPVSIRGLRLGMSRAEVVKKLGPPLREAPSQIYNHVREAQYKRTQAGGDPEILYDVQGRAVRVSGDFLEWEGGLLERSVSLKQMRQIFPELIELRAPVYHPYYPGAYYAEERNLILYAGVDGVFTSPHFESAELAVPYFVYQARPEQFKQPLLARTAGRRDNKLSELRKSQSVGCYQCGRVLKGAPQKRPDVKDGDWCVCPHCDREGLIGGTASEITPAFLHDLHVAWLEP